MSKSKLNPEDFSIAKSNKDFKKAIISRSNLTNEFTLEDIEKHEAHLLKNERELVAQISLTKAVVGNVERNHKFVSKMSDEQLAVAAYLHENRALLAKSEGQLKDVRRAMKNYKEVTDTIYNKFGFVKTELDESPS